MGSLFSCSLVFPPPPSAVDVDLKKKTPVEPYLFVDLSVTSLIQKEDD